MVVDDPIYLFSSVIMNFQFIILHGMKFMVDEEILHLLEEVVGFIGPH